MTKKQLVKEIEKKDFYISVAIKVIRALEKTVTEMETKQETEIQSLSRESKDIFKFEVKNGKEI